MTTPSPTVQALGTSVPWRNTRSWKGSYFHDHAGYHVAFGMNFPPNWAAEVNGSIGSRSGRYSGQYRITANVGAPTPPPPIVAAAPPPPPPDSDGNGVPDSIDQRPDTPKGDRVNSVGCTIKDEIKLERVHFETNKWEILPTSEETLNYGIATLNKYPQMVIEVRGHTDSTGTKKYNHMLSQSAPKASRTI